MSDGLGNNALVGLNVGSLYRPSEDYHNSWGPVPPPLAGNPSTSSNAGPSSDTNDCPPVRQPRTVSGGVSLVDTQLCRILTLPDQAQADSTIPMSRLFRGLYPQERPRAPQAKAQCVAVEVA